MSDKIFVDHNSIPSINISKDCQETSISWSRGDTIVKVDTSDITMITKLKNVMQRDPEHYKCYYYKNNLDKSTGKVSSVTFEFDLKLLSFRIATNRVFSEEEKDELKQRFRKNKSLNENC